MKEDKDNKTVKVAYISTLQDLIPRWQLEIKALKQDGYDVMVICLDRLCSRPEIENVNGTRIVRVQPATGNGSKHANAETVANWGVKKETTVKKVKTIASAYRTFAKCLLDHSVNVVHCCHPSLLPVAWYVKKKSGCKIIYEISEFYVEQIFLRFPKGLRFMEPVAFGIEDIFMKGMDGIVCYPSIGDVLSKRYSRHCINLKSVSNVPERNNLVDDELYKSLKEKYRNNKVIIYTGSLILKDGIIDAIYAMVEICRTHPEAKLLLVGASLDDDSESIKQIATERGVSNNIEIIPFQEYEKLFSYFLAADIGLAAFNKEYVMRFTKGNSRKVMEYMKGGLPIVGPDYGEVTLAVKEEKCGIVVSKWKRSEISKAINFLLDNTHTASEMANRSRQAFEKEYNWDIEKTKLLDVYKTATT